jgi:hypothetical protein
MNMLPGESIVLESEAKTLRLTTRRIRYHATEWGKADVVSIMPDEVASCGLIQTSYPLLLVLAAVCGMAIVGGPADARTFMLIVGAVVVGAYLATRRHVLAIGSAGHTLKISIQGMTTEQVMMFIEETEGAKKRRYDACRAVGL